MRAPHVLVPALLLCLVPGARAQETPPSPGPSPSAGPTPTFPTEVEVVTVDVVVTDKKGSPIGDLTRGEFTVTEDGRSQEVVSFEPVRLPEAPSATPVAKPHVSTNVSAEARLGRSFIVVFDDIHLSPAHAYRAKAAVAEFLKSGVREGDRVTLVATSGSAWWSTRLEAGRDELLALLKRLDGRQIPDTGNDRLSEYEAMKIHVFRDQQVMDRVQRRYDTYGVNPLAGSRSLPNLPGEGDPQILAKASEVYYQSVNKNRITLDIVERILDSLAPAKGRKSVILVSEGFIYDPGLDEFKRVTQASRRANAAVYFLDTRGLVGMPDAISAQFGPSLDPRDMGAAFSESLEAAEGAASIAADSGGFSVKNTNDLSKGIQRIAAESRIYYLLGYHSTNTRRDGKFREIKVKVARKGIEVRARKGYYAPLEGGAPALAKKQGSGDPELQTAVDSPYEIADIPLRMTAYVFDETLLGKANVAVVAEVDIRSFAFEEKEGRLQDTLGLLLVAAHRETGEYFKYDQKVAMNLLPQTRERLSASWFPVVRSFELAPGGYQVKLVVRDERSARIGTLIHEFEVPELSRFRISTPLLTDTLQAPREGETQSAPRPMAVAHRSFAVGAPLYFSFDVIGATKDAKNGMPRVSAGYLIRRVDGTVVTGAEPSPIQPTSLGRLSRLVGTRLRDAAPGDYELVITLKDEVADRLLEVREPFTLVADPAPSAGK